MTMVMAIFISARLLVLVLLEIAEVTHLPQAAGEPPDGVVDVLLGTRGWVDPPAVEDDVPAAAVHLAAARVPIDLVDLQQPVDARGELDDEAGLGLVGVDPTGKV